MIKSILTLEFKQYKSNANIHYFINEKTRELVIAIIYVDDIVMIHVRTILFLFLLSIFLDFIFLFF